MIATPTEFPHSGVREAWQDILIMMDEIRAMALALEADPTALPDTVRMKQIHNQASAQANTMVNLSNSTILELRRVDATTP
jgi:hypothetical protein